MNRFLPLFAATLVALPLAAQAQAPGPAPGAPTGAPQAARDLPMARLMSDGAQVRGGDSSRVILQLGKFVFSCRYGDDKPALCDQIP